MVSAQEKQEKANKAADDYTKHIRFAKVIKVYDSDTLADSKKYGAVDLVWLDTQDKVNGSVYFLKPGYSSVYGYGIIIMPSVGDIAACYTLPFAQPIILGFYSKDQYASLKAPQDNTGDVGYIQPLKAGEVLIKGRSQSSILLRNDGKVDITVKNGNKSTASLVNNNASYVTEAFTNKVDGGEANTTLTLSLGLSEETVGPSRRVFSCSSGQTVEQLFSIPALEQNLSYTLPPLSAVDVLDFKFVKIYTQASDGTKVLTKVLDKTSKVKLSKTYYYTQGLSSNEISEPPCTMDTNGIVVTVILPPSVSGLLKQQTVIEVMLVLRKNNFSMRVNDLGDLFIDCRNMVVRTTEGKSILGVYDDSRIVAKASETQIGDPMGGYINTTRGGVQSSSGVFESAANTTTDYTQIGSVLGDKFYFYILDQYPLFSYTPNIASPYAIVSANEYKALSDYDRNHIVCRTFDPDNLQQGFNRTTMNNLILSAASSNTPWVSYGELKSL